MNKIFAVAGIIFVFVIGFQSYEMYKLDQKDPCIQTLKSGTILNTIEAKNGDKYFDIGMVGEEALSHSFVASTSPKDIYDSIQNGKTFKMCYVIK